MQHDKDEHDNMLREENIRRITVIANLLPNVLRHDEDERKLWCKCCNVYNAVAQLLLISYEFFYSGYQIP